MKILELFSGYGTASFGLKRLGIPYELVGYSDIDKYANQCFQQNHGGKELGDVTKINPYELEDFDLLTGGFPCQSFSVAGKGLGELDTRGTLFNEIIRIAEVKNPRYMLLENVKGLTNKPHRETFNKIISEIKRIGYYVSWMVLNSKEYGIPQNRERVWFVCFKEKEDYNRFEFPQKEELKIFLKDILEDEVDEKYYLSEKQTKRLLESDDIKKKFSSLNPKIAITQTARQYASWRGNHIAEVKIINPLKGKTNNGWHFEQNVYDIGGITRSVKAGGGSGNIPKIIIDRNKCTCNEGGECEVCCVGCGNYLDECECEPISVSMANKNRGLKPYNKDNREYHLEKNKIDGVSHTVKSSTHEFMVAEPKLMNPKKMGNIYPSGGQNGNIYSIYGLSPTLRSGQGILGNGIGSNNSPKIMGNNYRIRKLTPKECFRLMGFLNDEINLEGLSNTQRYKLAGNGQDVNVVTKIFERMFGSHKETKTK